MLVASSTVDKKNIISVTETTITVVHCYPTPKPEPQPGGIHIWEGINNIPTRR